VARYRTGVTKAAPATGTFVSQFRTPADRVARIFEIKVFTSTAVALSVGVIRSATVGATFTSATPQAEDVRSVASTCAVDTAITTAPTIGTVYMEKIVLPAVIGSGMIWTFPQGLVVPVSAGLLLWNFGAATGPAVEVSWIHDE